MSSSSGETLAGLLHPFLSCRFAPCRFAVSFLPVCRFPPCQYASLSGSCRVSMSHPERPKCNFSRSVQFTLRHSPPPNPHILRHVPKLSVIVSLFRPLSTRLVSLPVSFGCRLRLVAGFRLPASSGFRLYSVFGSIRSMVADPRNSPLVIIPSVSLVVSTLSLHFEHIHSFHPNHCRHPIHHCLRSLFA